MKRKNEWLSDAPVKEQDSPEKNCKTQGLKVDLYIATVSIKESEDNNNNSKYLLILKKKILNPILLS